MRNQASTNSSGFFSTDPEAVDQSPILPPTKVNLIAPILLTVVISAAVFGSVGYFLGKKTLPTNIPQFQAETLSSPSIVPSPTSQQLPTQTVSPKSENTENQIGYVKSIFTKDGVDYLTIDYVQWLNQEEGECHSSSETQSSTPECNPNGYLIVNNNSQIRTFEISNSIVIDFSDFKGTGLVWKDNQALTTESISLDEFKEIFSEKDASIKWLKDAIYHIELSENTVVKIRYQYQP